MNASQQAGGDMPFPEASAAAPVAFRLHLIGSVRLSMAADPAGQPIRLGPRAAALLAMLALAEDGLERRDRLAALLWERVGPTQQLDSLRHCLADIGRTAPGLVQREGRWLRLDRSRCSLDIDLLPPSGPAPGAGQLLDLPTFGPAFGSWRESAAAVLARHLGRAHHQPDRVMPQPAPSPAVVQPLPLAATAGPRILIPPPETGSGADGTLATALAEELADTLARFRDVRVVLEPTPLADLPEGRHPPCLAVQLKVQAGDMLSPLVGFRLLEWPSRALIWSDRYSLADADVSAALHRLAQRVVGGLLPEVERAVLAAETPVSGDIYRAYLEARRASLQPADHASALAAADLLESLIARAPAFSLAYPPLIRLYNTDFFYTRAGSSRQQERDRAYELARTVTRLDPGHVHGWVHLGWCHLWRSEWDQAEAAFDRAVQLNPFHPERLCQVAFGLLHLGRLDKAEALLVRCRDILDLPDAIYWNARGLLHLLRGEPLEARAALEPALGLYIWTHVYALVASVQAGLDPATDASRLRADLVRIWGRGHPPGADEATAWLRRSGMPFQSSRIASNWSAIVAANI